MPLDWQVIVTQVVEEMFTAAAIVAAVAFVGKSAVESFFRSKVDALTEQLKHKNSQELEGVKFQFLLALQQEKASADLQTFRTQQILETEKDFQTRIRTEILAWANPILNSVRDLRWRLINILNKGAYPALDDGVAPPDPNWSISFAYLLDSTIFLFAQYFCWVQMLQQELSFELFRSHIEKDAFFAALRQVSDSAGDFPPAFAGTGNDSQVFRLQQRAIGEALATMRDGKRLCISFSEFSLRREDEAFQSFFVPVRNLLYKVKPGEKRWNRLVAVCEALGALERHCEHVLDISNARHSEPAAADNSRE